MPFVDAKPNEDDRIIANIHGRTKRGKTSLALTFPRPLFLLDLDHGVRELFRPEPSLGEGVQVAEYHIPERYTSAEAEKMLEQMLDDYQDACEAAAAGGTVVVDTHTQWHQIIQKVKLDKIVEKRVKEMAQRQKVRPQDIDTDLTRIFPYDYREANALETALLQRPYLYPKLNAVFLNRHRELYSGAEPTGKYGFQGFSGTEDLVQLNIEMKLKGEEKGPIVAVFGPNRWRSDLVGMVWDDPLTYADLKEMFLDPPKKKGRAA